MSIYNLVTNGSYENGTLLPWLTLNTTLTSQFAHLGYYSARLEGGTLNSYIAQFVEARPGDSYEFLISLAKIGPTPSPPITLQVLFYDESYNYLGNGLISNILPDNIPNVENDTWTYI